MSSPAPAADAAHAAPAGNSKKKLIIIGGAVAVLLAGGGGAFFMMKKSSHSAEEGGEADSGHEKPAAKHEKSAHAPTSSVIDPKNPPTYLPLENMVVNLTDPGGNRFVQLSITLKIDDAKTGDAIKLYMPTIRSGILLLVSQRSAEELLSITGKEKLTRSIIREISGQLGYEVDDEDEDPPEDEPPAKKKKKKKRAAAPPSPIQAVLYTSFIVQ